jgi:hypothetical protein
MFSLAVLNIREGYLNNNNNNNQAFQFQSQASWDRQEMKHTRAEK